MNPTSSGIGVTAEHRANDTLPDALPAGANTAAPANQPCTTATGTAARCTTMCAPSEHRPALPAFHVAASFPAPRAAVSAVDDRLAPLRSMHEPPQEIFARCPTIVAVNEDHWMVHCTDDIVRRAVPDRITGNYFPGSDGHAYWTDMFAAPGHACHPPVTGTQLASYEYYQSDKKLAYHVNSEPEPSLIAESPLYPLAPGTFMVVPRFGKCHIIAAVQALLAEGKSRWAAAAQLRACKWDTTIASAFTLRAHLSGLAGAEHRHLKFCSGMDRYWVRTGIFLVRDLMEEVGGPCLFLYCGQAIIIDEISRHAFTTNLMKKNWQIRLRLFRSCSWMEVSHPADILTAARELTPLRPPPQQPRFQTFAKPMFNQEQWAAFCIGMPGKTPMECRSDLIKNSYS